MLSSQWDNRPIQGVGIGLRSPHYEIIERELPQVPWFEVLSDNYMGKGGSALQHLENIRNNYPITFHGVGMSLGSTDPLNLDYLQSLKSLINRFEPTHVSDHLCWMSVGGHYAHDLLPLPYTDEALNHIADRIQQVQDILGRKILVENVSSYMRYKHSAMFEWEFYHAVVERADCDMLLDINNIYVSAYNHKFDAEDYLTSVPAERVREFHLAGYEDQGDLLLDTHGQRVHPPVWDLYENALQCFGPIPTLLEWDTDIPEFAVLEEEAARARLMMEEECRDVA